MTTTKNIVNLNFKLVLATGLVALCTTPNALAEKGKEAESKSADTAKSGDASPQGDNPLKPGETYSCKADIFYHWTPEPITPPAPSPSGSAESIASPASTSLPPQTDYYSSIEERGMNKQTIRENILARIPGVKTEALNHCRQSRSAGACKEGKLKSANAHYQLLDFETRRQFLESINRSCEGTAGICTEASASEVSCGIFRSPDAGIPEAESKSEAPAAATGKKGK